MKPLTRALFLALLLQAFIPRGDVDASLGQSASVVPPAPLSQDLDALVIPPPVLTPRPAAVSGVARPMLTLNGTWSFSPAAHQGRGHRVNVPNRAGAARGRCGQARRRKGWAGAGEVSV